MQMYVVLAVYQHALVRKHVIAEGISLDHGEGAHQARAMV